MHRIYFAFLTLAIPLYLHTYKVCVPLSRIEWTVMVRVTPDSLSHPTP
jgi:hypothetical protein